MKKVHGVKRALEPMRRQDLEAMPSGALLARLKRLRWCEQDRAGSDLTDAEVLSVSHLILFKEDARWKTAYADLKSILANREHIGRET